jgi:hypothetical protein
MRSPIVTSCVWESVSLTVEQRAKVVQRGHRNTRSNFVGELLTGKRIQHPGRYRHLHVIHKLDDHTVSRVAPEPTNDLYVFAVKRMMSIVNDGWGRFMSSVRMRCVIRLRRICWRTGMTSGPCRNC